MAYIDKDKALNLDFRINVSLFESRRKTAERAVQAYADAINAIPAADVRPVVRGEWVQDCEYHFRCSVCGDRWTVSNGNPLDLSNGWNFCPNCGAMMEES